MSHLINRLLIHHMMMALGIAVLATGCKDVTAGLPAGTPDPSTLNTPAGALQKRNAVYVAFETALFKFEGNTALISDEAGDDGDDATYSPEGGLDERLLPEGGNVLAGSYEDLQTVRGHAAEAIGTLAKYDTVHSPALRGEMYALQGYAEIMLAELYCSGVPLSTYIFEGDFTYKPGSTQQQVYQDAISKLDTAVALSSDSAHILNMARVGLGRTYLDLGDYPHAAAAVAAVPTDFRYQVSELWAGPGGIGGYGASERVPEGINGLPFLVGGDPRTRDTTTGRVDPILGLLYWPLKYRTALAAPYRSPITLADGVEARLIQAEAAYHGVATGSGSWLDQLNALRTTSTTCTVQTTPCTASAGSGGVDSLPLLVDPGSSAGDTARVNLLFSERAYWLYLTGHRQGDLRRLVRNYHRDQRTVYPTGPYGINGRYGSDVTVPIPRDQESPNPYFHGCLDRDA